VHQSGDDRGGRHLGDKSFFPQGTVDDDASHLDAFLAQHYLGAHMPPVIIVNQDVSAALRKLLENNPNAESIWSATPSASGGCGWKWQKKCCWPFTASQQQGPSSIAWRS
jgi:excinuclease UvrABC nuclease subunit